MKKFFPLLVFFIVLACTASNPVVGTWIIDEYYLAGERNSEMEGQEIVFKADGTVGGFIGEGTYEIADSKVVCKVTKVAEFEVEMMLVDGKLIVENPATKIIYKKKF